MFSEPASSSLVSLISLGVRSTVRLCLDLLTLPSQTFIIFIPSRISDPQVKLRAHKTLLVIFTTSEAASDNHCFLVHYCLNISMHGVTAYG